MITARAPAGALARYNAWMNSRLLCALRDAAEAGCRAEPRRVLRRRSTRRSTTSPAPTVGASSRASPGRAARSSPELGVPTCSAASPALARRARSDSTSRPARPGRAKLTPEWVAEELTYDEQGRRRDPHAARAGCWSTHLFDHQTHHRGQVDDAARAAGGSTSSAPICRSCLAGSPTPSPASLPTLDPAFCARAAQPSLRSDGNRITSRMLGESVSSITSRSMPMPQPPVGGMPISRARMKSAS